MTISGLPTTTALDALAGGGATPTLQAGYGVSMTDMGNFAQALARAGGQSGTLQATPVHAPGQTLQAMFRPLTQINTQAADLSAQADAARLAGQAMTPGEMIELTVRCQEFMFNCQLTSNAANRTSDGLQQLFRQQA